MSISVVVLAYGPEPYLADCVRSVLDTAPADTDLVVVDNGSPAVGGLAPDTRVQVVRPGRNTGFSGGCNAGARAATGDVLVFLNSDATVGPGAVEALARAVEDPTVALASGGVRLADQPDRMNTVGNPVHYLGIVWAGGFGDPAADHPSRREVTTASGAFLAVRRTVWQELGGFPEEYFAYHEDTELSLHARLRGHRVLFEPAAVAWHHYEFARNPMKQYLLERNRWLTVLTTYPRPVLLAVLPMLVLFELPLLAVAAIQGWAGQKLRGWVWLVCHARAVCRRRVAVQAGARLGAGHFADLLVSRIEPAVLGQPPGLGALNAVLAGYWWVARRIIPS